MTQRSYTIRKVFLVPLGVDAFLLFILWAISMLPQGASTERIVFTVFFVPSLYLFIECFFRRITVDESGILMRKLWRTREVSWKGITHVGGLAVHNKVYLLLTTVNGFFIISNAYGGFSGLMEEIVSHVDEERVEEGIRHQAGCSPSGVVHSALAWTAAAVMAGIILIKITPLIG